MSEGDSLPERRRWIALGILRYLINHPEAKDTVDGVLRWWLPRGEGEPNAEETRAALEFLVNRSFVTVSTVAPQAVVYGARVDRIEAVETFLREGVS